MREIRQAGPVDAALAEWFLRACLNGRLPAEPFDLAPAVRVTDLEAFYRWIAGVIERGDAGATAREAEGYVRKLQALAGKG